MSIYPSRVDIGIKQHVRQPPNDLELYLIINLNLIHLKIKLFCEKISRVRMSPENIYLRLYHVYNT